MKRLVHKIASLLSPVESKSRMTTMLLITVAVFIVSRIVYRASGIRFEAFENDHLLHFLSRDLLRDDLLRSLWHLHTQPPLFNFFIGIMVKVFPGVTTAAFQWFFFAVGLVLTISLFMLMIRMGVSSIFSAALTILFVISPACILFENILLYTYFVATLLILAGFFLHRFLSGSRFFDCFIFFTMLALVILTRSFFHPAWFALILILLLVPAWRLRRKIIIAASVPLFVVLLLYAKNVYYFGSFSSSSWLGMSFSKMTTFRLSEDERIDLIRKGDLSELSLLPPFKAIWFYNQYVTIPGFEKTGIPILDMEFYPNVGNNWNNLSFLSISRQYMKDALFVLKSYPRKYSGSVIGAFRIYFFPASDWFHFYSSIDNIGKIKTVEKLFDALFYGQLFGIPRPEKLSEHGDEYFGKTRNIGVFLLAGFLIAVIYGTYLVFREVRKRTPDMPFLATVLFFLITIGYVTVVSNVFETGENERFRFNIDPMLLVMTGVFLTNGIKPVLNHFYVLFFARPKKRTKRKDAR